MRNLQPRSVWSHFAMLCATPRPSRHEAALRDHLVAWAGSKHIQAEVDHVGNLILRKPASPGCEGQPGVILQGHLDMVCQANAGTMHDFERDPIRTVVRDGWVVAEETTLGADNGIGVALALAALEAEDLRHPALEVLLTINEEDGMDGARLLEPGTLQGRILINLDTEEWGHFYLGCAGGVDVEVRQKLSSEAVPDGLATYRIDVAGLRGGHSGIDIHLGRGNAIKLLTEALRELGETVDLRLVEMRGGTARNAIPREATALIALPAAQAESLADQIGQLQMDWRSRFAGVDPGISLTCRDAGSTQGEALARDERDRLLAYLAEADNGVAAMSTHFPDVVETSDNLGVLRLANGELRITFKLRSLDDAKADALADRMVAQARGHGFDAAKGGAYPGWPPQPDSPLLALCRRVFQERFGQPASTQVIHAGLECGLIAASHPHLDMISFGPDIRGAHAPGERVDIASVDRCWRLLRSVLEALASD